MNSAVKITDEESMMNDPLIRYEVALEIVGAEIGALMQAAMEEERKAHPNAELIAYYVGEDKNLRAFRRSLRSTNKEAIDAILDRKVLWRAVVNA
jgi:hypothetical protein